jgi:regulatory protein
VAEKDPLELAAQSLRHRDRSRRDVDDRLARAGIGDAARGETLDALERLGYVDDGRFARTRAAALAERGYGDAYIRADLERQGTPANAVDEAVAELPDEAERATALVERDGRSARTAARLARKGFAAETLEQLLGLAEAWDEGAPAAGGAQDD